MNTQSRWISFCLVAGLLAGCAHAKKQEFDAALNQANCEQALEKIPENDASIRYLGKAERAAGTAFSYTATGAGYTADVVLRVVGGAVVLATLCSPVLLGLALSGASGGHADLSGLGGGCLTPSPGSDAADLKGPEYLGDKVYKATEDMRCPDLTALSRSMRRVAGCYEAKGDLDNLNKAKSTVMSIVASPRFVDCISADEQRAANADLFRVQGMIHALDPNDKE